LQPQHSSDSIIRIEYFVSLGDHVNHCIVRAASAALVVLLAAGATGCRIEQDNADSSGSQQEQQGASDSLDSKADETCAQYRLIYDDMQPTDAERQLTGHDRTLSSYKSMQKFYAAFGQLFPESARAANALSDIYRQAARNTLSPAEEAKIGGYDDKINVVIDKYCPNSGYPAS
jgi:hypothetical protein